jgi:phosphoribosylformylglycinamidine cyclo-ligase
MMMVSAPTPLAPNCLSPDEAYRQAGVDLVQAKAIVPIAKKASQRTQKSSSTPLLGGIGGFCGAFTLPTGYETPVLLVATDGVGTKLEIAQQAGHHATIGVDLVAMSVNDILVQGGKPLVFLDYLATDKIRHDVFESILEGVATGCEQAGCALVGGETAEMPNFYQPHQYDLAGFAVGVVEKANLLPKTESLAVGDVLLGLSSSGFHSNGYSLVRKTLQENQITDWQVPLPTHPAVTIGEALLAPTVIYVQPILALLEAFPTAVKAMVHSTGGGFQDNLPRVVPAHLQAVVQPLSWDWSPVISYIQQLGGYSMETMLNTFNCGVGFVLLVNRSQAATVQQWLETHYPQAFNVFEIGVLAAMPQLEDSESVVFQYLKEEQQ